MNNEGDKISKALNQCFAEVQLTMAVIDRWPWELMLKMIDRCVDEIPEKLKPHERKDIQNKRAIFAALDNLCKVYKSALKEEIKKKSN